MSTNTTALDAQQESGEIEFTRYSLPNGRRSIETIKRPAEIAHKAAAIVAAGYSFECEMLGDGTVSLTITDDDADHAIELCPNGPGIPAAVDRLVTGFKIPAKRARRAA